MAEKSCFSIGADTLLKGEYITESQTLISKDGIFELGFFKPGGSNPNSSQNIYLGIWYKDFPKKTVVWVANREKPLPNMNMSGFKLKVVPNGNLGLYHNLDSFWSTSLMLTLPESVEAVLLDDGNLILRDGLSPDTIFWQSFDHPTHTWLTGAKLGFNKTTGKTQRLVSWKSIDDPSPGAFSLEISRKETSFFLLWNMSTEYWSSGAWNGNVFVSASQLSYLANFNFFSDEIGTYFSYSLFSPQVFSMFVLDSSGNFMQHTSLRSNRNWSTTFELPKRDIFGFCGGFGVFSENSLNPCRCLQGFASLSGGGCSRISILQCESSEGHKDGFVRISDIMFPANPIAHPVQSDRECLSACQLDCSCTAYAFTQNGCSIWEGPLLHIQNVSNNQGNEQFLYLKLAHSELQISKGRKKILEVIIAVVVPMVVVFSGGALGCFYSRRNKQKEGKEKGDDLLSFDFDHSVKQQPSNDGTILRRRNNTDFDLPVFSYASVSAATNNFSPENKLGEGGFGPVYKGKLMNGQEVALKRLSKKSGQGFEEFRNEILLIAKLQHRNLVRLLGCCIDPDESILIYEYMPNKSLDFFLFDSNKQKLLDWATRIHIVEGIAQGLLYLHEYSRVRIIHRDLKASNILLDGEMNPKISDFGMARIFGGNDSRGSGYMAPEYALQGLFSIKSDVFSFGVLVLEILSGKKNTGFYQTDSLNLLGHAWELWISKRGVEVVDDKQRVEDGEDAPRGTPNTKDAVKSLTTQIKDMAVKVSGTSKGKAGDKFKIGQRSYPELETSSDGVPYPYFQPGSSSTPAWHFGSGAAPRDSAYTAFGGDMTPNRISSRFDDMTLGEAEDGPKEWMAQVEPGVQITFVSLPRGGNDLKRIRFSREMFDKSQAQRWWSENFDRIMELYNVQKFNQQALNATPGRSECGRDSNYSRLGSVRESPAGMNYRDWGGQQRYSNYYNGEASRATTASRDEDSVSISNASEVEAEWIEEDEPGVYITIRQLLDGTRELRRVRFSYKSRLLVYYLRFLHSLEKEFKWRFIQTV
ncbi:hypothetical protein C2S52_009720 [Perilla frutescens var. hirtella]|nr:hypothetical protein C2S52_009720 [Perilla frutescens var. hirtella]